MARTVIIERAGRRWTFDISRIERRHVHGETRRVALDARGRECGIGQLTGDGRWLLVPGSTADLYVDKTEGDCIDRADLVALDAVGRPLEAQPSTLDTSQPLGEPVSFEAFFGEYIITAVYRLEADADTGLDTLLPDEMPHRLPFRYRAGTGEQTAFVFRSDEYIWLVVAEPTGFDFLGFDETPGDFDDEDDGRDTDDFALWPFTSSLR